MATNGYENSERHHQINHSHDSNFERKASISQKILTKTMIGALIICGIIVVCIQVNTNIWLDEMEVILPLFFFQDY